MSILGHMYCIYMDCLGSVCEEVLIVTVLTPWFVLALQLDSPPPCDLPGLQLIQEETCPDNP